MKQTPIGITHATICPAGNLAKYFDIPAANIEDIVIEGLAQAYFCNDELWVSYSELAIALQRDELITQSL